MEISTEINKVFGQEMAKLFATQISEEEMLETAKSVWTDMQSESGPSWDRTSPESTKVIKVALKEKLSEQVQALTETNEFKDECRTLAEQMVNEIREETHRKVVEEVSSRLAGLSAGYGGMGLRGMIEQIIMETIARR